MLSFGSHGSNKNKSTEIQTVLFSKYLTIHREKIESHIDARTHVLPSTERNQPLEVVSFGHNRQSFSEIPTE